MKNSLRIFGAPSRYIQGPGAIDCLGENLARIGSRAALIADTVVLSLFGERIVAACQAANIECEVIEFSGEIIPDEVTRLAQIVKSLDADVVVGCGGGKGIDAGKGVAHMLGLPIVTIPTAASNDAPTSKNYVLYDRNHKLLRVEHMPANPALVLVDTEIIVNAPAHLFTSGIGDAIVKKFEVAQCIAAGGNNMFGGQACRAAQALTELCYETLRADAVDALAAVKNHSVNDSVERVVEATVLHSGLGFESGGLSISHAMTRGLSAVRGARDALHGHQVAYALLVQLVLENRNNEFLEDIESFYRVTELPRSLKDLELKEASANEIASIAEGTMTAPHVKNFQRALKAEDIAAAIRAVEARSVK